MAQHNSNKQILIPAVGYIRRSTSMQEMSLKDQRKAIERYAEQNGYVIVRWYEDDAISGDDTSKRLGFLAMQHDACNGRDFDAMLVWDQDRFGRFDSIEAGHWIFPMRNAGVKLVTVNEGPVDWNDFTGRMMYSIKQEGKHQFLIDLSRNSTRGRLSTALQGFLCGQAAPYGFDRMLVDATGEHQQRVRNGEQVTRPKSWKVTLVPSDDPEKVKTVRYIFQTFAETDMGLRAIANELNRRGIAGPAVGQIRKGKPVSGKWYAGSVRFILDNEAYIGVFTYAKRTMGKYNRVSKGDVKPRDLDDFNRAKVKKNADPCIRFEDAFEALVERSQWEQVAKKLKSAETRNDRQRRKHPDRFLLSGLVVCGCCGGVMHGITKSKQKGKKRYEWTKYICSSYHKFGNRDKSPDGSGCYHNTVDQAALMDFILAKIRLAIFAGGKRDELRDLIRQRLEARQQIDPAEMDGLKKRLGELDAQVDRAANRLLTAPDDLTEILAPKITEMRLERQRAADRLAEAENASQPVDVEAEAERAVDRLWSLSQELDTANPARLRELVRRLVGKVELWFTQDATGKRLTSMFTRGVIFLNADGQIFSPSAYVGTSGLGLTKQ